MIQISLTALSGYVMGIMSLMLTRLLIKRRTEQNITAFLISSAYSCHIWGIFSAAVYVIIFEIAGLNVFAFQYSLIFSICLCISAVDFLIRKIPNELLIALFAIKILFMTAFYEPHDVTKSIIGFGLAIIVFSLPSYFGMNIGWGDIKFASAAGFYFGMFGLLQVVIIMALSLSAYAVYLYITKRGNLRTASAMGPYISLGIIVTMLYPIINAL